MELYLGSGGYTNDDWKGILYPPGAPSSEYLESYARYFNAVELESPFYNIPGKKAFEGMVRKSGGHVHFAVKAHRAMTHMRNADEDGYRRLRVSVKPLQEAGVLGPFLAQFPRSFHNTPDNNRYLHELVSRFEGETLAIEFRNPKWHTPEVEASLRDKGVTWVSIDYPEIAGMGTRRLVTTSPIAYIRLFGRNEKKWYAGKTAKEKHDYRYSTEELRFWVEEIVARRDELDQAYLILLNTPRFSAGYNLTELQQMFEEHGLDGGVRDIPAG
ncbi:MAG: DUF72 domain-containing protein [Trueperaceae bacterium]